MSSSHNKTWLDFPIEECYASFTSHYQRILVNQIGNPREWRTFEFGPEFEFEFEFELAFEFEFEFELELELELELGSKLEGSGLPKPEPKTHL